MKTITVARAIAYGKHYDPKLYWVMWFVGQRNCTKRFYSKQKAVNFAVKLKGKNENIIIRNYTVVSPYGTKIEV